jgi:hypothetical protein
MFHASSDETNNFLLTITSREIILISIPTITTPNFQTQIGQILKDIHH